MAPANCPSAVEQALSVRDGAFPVVRQLSEHRVNAPVQVSLMAGVFRIDVGRYAEGAILEFGVRQAAYGSDRVGQVVGGGMGCAESGDYRFHRVFQGRVIVLSYHQVAFPQVVQSLEYSEALLGVGQSIFVILPHIFILRFVEVIRVAAAIVFGVRDITTPSSKARVVM